MSAARYIGTALTLGGAFVAMTMLSTLPSEAKRVQLKKGHFVGTKAFRPQLGKTSRSSLKRIHGGTADGWKPPGKDPKDPGLDKPNKVSSHPLPPGTYDLGKLPPGKGDPKMPVKVGDPIKVPPGTFDPGTLPPGKGDPKTPPIEVGDPIKVPPGTFDPGKLPPGTQTSPQPGGSWPPPPGPVVIVAPPPVTGIAKDDLAITVKIPDGGTENCDPCAWLKLSYDQTRLVKWLDRYRLCLSWQRGT